MEYTSLKITSFEIATALTTFPDNGKPPADERLYLVWLHMEAIGLIVSETQQSPCKTCGTPRTTHSYHRITAAGRLVRDIAEKGLS